MNLFHVAVPVQLTQICLWCVLGACCDNAVHLGDGLRLRPLRLCRGLWVSVSLSAMIQMWLVFCMVFFLSFSFYGKPGLFSVTGAWTTNVQCILCLWTRMRTWLLRRSQWPCTQTTCLLVASPTRTCRWENPKTSTKTPKATKIIVEIQSSCAFHVVPLFID